MNLVLMSKTLRFSGVALLVAGLFLSVGVASAQTADSFCYTFSRDLTVGSTGADVTALQKVLQRDGLTALVTGYFGPITKAGVITFQQRYGINPTGYVGAFTRAKLNSLYGCTSVTSTITPTSVTASNVSTNYGFGYLTDGTYITFLLANGVYTVQTPASLLGRTVTKGADGKYTLVGTSPPAIPTVTILSPNGGETFTAETMPVSWTSAGIPSTATLSARVISNATAGLSYPLGSGFVNDGSEAFTIPTSVQNGSYNIELKVIGGLPSGTDYSYGAYSDYSGNFTITRTATLAPSGTFRVTIAGTTTSAGDGGTLTVPPSTNPYSGTPLTVTWSAQNVSRCMVQSRGTTIIGGTGLTGSTTYAPKTSTTLSLTCLDSNEAVVLTKSVNIVITSTTAVPTITTTSLPSGTVGTAYTAGLTSTGGTGTPSWAITAGDLPAGITLSTAGVFSGTPTSDGPDAGTQTFTVTVTVGTQTASKQLSIIVRPPAVSADVSGTLDYNNDHKLDQTDVQFLLDVAVGTRTCPTGKTCDINKSGLVTSTDSLVLARYIGTATTPGKYDYDNDLKIDSADVTFLSLIVGESKTCPVGRVCDVNGSGVVTSADVLTLQSYVGTGTVLGASVAPEASERACPVFAANLTRSASGSAVTALQSALIKDGESISEVTGYFGSETAAAVRAFQEKYASDVLTPNGLTQGTGFVGAATRAKLNQLFGCPI